MKTDANKCTACTICIALLVKDTDCCKQQAGLVAVKTKDACLW